MPNQLRSRTTPDATPVFRALADPTRRAILERLGQAPASTTTLAAGFAMALPSFMQHLAVLEECGLVTSHKQGRTRIYRLTPAPMRAAEDWLSRQRDLWERRLDQLDDYLHTMEQET